MSFTLDQLHKGEEATIDFINNSEISLKLAEMGCFAGERLKLEHIAPMGDPIAINVSGYIISLRKKEAKSVFLSK